MKTWKRSWKRKEPTIPPPLPALRRGVEGYSSGICLVRKETKENLYLRTDKDLSSRIGFA